MISRPGAAHCRGRGVQRRCSGAAFLEGDADLRRSVKPTRDELDQTTHSAPRSDHILACCSSTLLQPVDWRKKYFSNVICPLTLTWPILGPVDPGSCRPSKRPLRYVKITKPPENIQYSLHSDNSCTLPPFTRPGATHCRVLGKDCLTLPCYLSFWTHFWPISGPILANPGPFWPVLARFGPFLALSSPF